MDIPRSINSIDAVIRKKLNISFADFVFWLSYCLLLVIHCIENTSLTYLDVSWLSTVYLFRNFLYLVLLFKAFALTSYTDKELIAVFLAILIGIASFLGTDDFGLCEFIIVIIAAKDISPKSLVSVFAWIKGASVALTLLFYSLGILPTLHYLDDAVGSYNTYGFCHRNVLGANMVVLCLAWFYLRYKKLNKWDVLIWCALSVITYKLAVSRSSLIIMFTIIAGTYLYKQFESRLMKIKNIENILIGIFVFLLLLSIICTLLYNSDSAFWTLVDKFFTKRLRFANQCFREYGLSLFGQKIPFLSSLDAQNTDAKKLILDNAFMRALLFYGIIPGTLFLYSYYSALKNAVHKHANALIICLIIFSIYGLTERYMLDVNYNFPLLIACQSFFSSSEVDFKAERKTALEFAFDYMKRRLK